MRLTQSLSREKAFKAREFILLFAAVAVVLYIYRGAFGGFFMFDDFGWLKFSRAETLGQHLRCFLEFNGARTYRPLSQETLFFVGQFLFGLRPFGFHCMSFAFHILGTVALYFLLRQFFPPLPSITGTLFYGVHNAHTLAVYWISAIPEPMAAAFYAISFFFFIRFDRTGRLKFYALSLLAAALGIMSKESILTLPLAIIAYCLLLGKWRWKWAIPYFVLPMATIVGRLTGTAGASPYPLTFGSEALHNLFAYISWMAGFSDSLIMMKLHWELHHTLIAAVTILILAGLVWFCRSDNTGIFAIIWLFLALQPVLYFSGHSFSYYLAPALLALSFLISAAISAVMRAKWIAGATVAAVIACYGCWAAEASVKREGRWWVERSFVARNILKQMPDIARQVPPGHTAFIFGFGPEELGVLQTNGAFEAYGFPTDRFIIKSYDEDAVRTIERLRDANQLAKHHFFLFSQGSILDRTSLYRTAPPVSNSPSVQKDVPKIEFVNTPKVRIRSNLSRLGTGEDSLIIRILNFNAPSIDLLYEFNGQRMEPVLDQHPNRRNEISVPINESTPRGAYHLIGIRNSATREINQWIALDFEIVLPENR